MVKTHKFLLATGLAFVGVSMPLAGLAHADDNYTYEVSFTATGTHTLAKAGSNGVQVDGSNVITLVNADDPSSGPIGTASCNDGNTQCTIAVTDGPTGVLNYNGSAFSIKTNNACNTAVDFEYRINHTSALSITDPEANLFTGKIWFFWNCDGGFCKRLITGITGTEDNDDPFTGHTITYNTKWVNQTTIHNDTTIGDAAAGDKTPDVKALSSTDDYRIIWEVPGNTPANNASLNTWAKYLDWERAELAATGPVTCTNGEGNDYQTNPSYDRLKQLRIDPTGASKGKSIISTNGDRAFRLTIYDPATYFGVTNAANPGDLNKPDEGSYWPDFWDQGMFNPAYDISETSATNPQTMQAYLLSNSITLKKDEISGTAISNIAVASEDVPEGAVNITSIDNGASWKIAFNSNYYDKVVFKITAGGKDYYLQINRVTITPFMPDDHNGHSAGIRLYTPNGDDGKYDVLGTYYLQDGSKKTVKLEKVNTSALAGGQGLSAWIYKVPASANISFSHNEAPLGASFTTLRSGSTPTNFNGTLAGSGKGTFYTFSEQGIIFGKQF